MREFAKNNGCGEDTLAKIDTWLVKKTPDRYEVKIPSKIFYDYVDFMRGRINKGMNVAEDAIWESATECLFRTTKAKTKKDIELEIERNVIGGVINSFRINTGMHCVMGSLTAPLILMFCCFPKSLMRLLWQATWEFKMAEQLGLRLLRQILSFNDKRIPEKNKT